MAKGLPYFLDTDEEPEAGLPGAEGLPDVPRFSSGSESMFPGDNNYFSQATISDSSHAYPQAAITIQDSQGGVGSDRNGDGEANEARTKSTSKEKGKGKARETNEDLWAPFASSNELHQYMLSRPVPDMTFIVQEYTYLTSTVNPEAGVLLAPRINKRPPTPPKSFSHEEEVVSQDLFSLLGLWRYFKECYASGGSSASYNTSDGNNVLESG